MVTPACSKAALSLVPRPCFFILSTGLQRYVLTSFGSRQRGQHRERVVLVEEKRGRGENGEKKLSRSWMHGLLGKIFAAPGEEWRMRLPVAT